LPHNALSQRLYYGLNRTHFFNFPPPFSNKKTCSVFFPFPPSFFPPKKEIPFLTPILQLPHMVMFFSPFRVTHPTVFAPALGFFFYPHNILHFLLFFPNEAHSFSVGFLCCVPVPVPPSNVTTSPTHSPDRAPPLWPRFLPP